jgi:carbon monoxide dehydrogenase subunit G
VKLAYDGQEQIQAAPDTVWAFLNDPEKVGACMPGVHEVTVHDARHFDATVKVALGVVRGKFKFKVELSPDEAARRMAITATGGGLGSVVDLDAGATVKAADGDGTLLDWQGEATMRGPLASVGGHAIDSQAKKLVEQMFANVKQQVDAGA